jgi:hypothetical protein
LVNQRCNKKMTNRKKSFILTKVCLDNRVRRLKENCKDRRKLKGLGFKSIRMGYTCLAISSCSQQLRKFL